MSSSSLVSNNIFVQNEEKLSPCLEMVYFFAAPPDAASASSFFFCFILIRSASLQIRKRMKRNSKNEQGFFWMSIITFVYVAPRTNHRRRVCPCSYPRSSWHSLPWLSHADCHLDGFREEIRKGKQNNVWMEISRYFYFPYTYESFFE